MATVTITYFGVEASGRNVTDAKREAGRKIEAALEGAYNPKIIAWRGYAALVFRSPEGWSYRLILDPEGIREGTIYGGGCNGQTEKETIIGASRHLADLGWRIEDGESIPSILNGDKEGISDYVYKTKFRIRYYKARQSGMSETDAHSYAGKDPARPELWLNVEL